MIKRTTIAHRASPWCTLVSHRAGVSLHRPRRPRAPVPAAAPPPALSTEQQRRAAELEQELQLARDIQQGLLLEAAPHLPGWELAAISIPARDLGGDLYDFLSLGDGVQGIMIGDVSGKGLSAALRMAVARTVFRHEARRDEAPGPTLAGVNRGILSEIPHGMVTMLYLRLDPACGLLRVANAGHTFPLFVNGRVSELELSGLPLGVDADSDYVEATAEVGPGDSVILYTDGVIEAENKRNEIFTYERLQALVEANARLKPRAMVALLLHALRSWSSGGQSDDVTIVVLRRRLTCLDDELRGIADEVLGAERAAAFWDEAAPAGTTGAEVWLAALPGLLKLAQDRFGRGLARELNQQLRLVIEDYRR
ncbi:MAG: PP2C family protein-serine/threonine phosphatase [Chloroflexales bacterium]|nr:PP2C family protein-serine/threonine phosphatase [Chloroflexales bacterium]